MSNIFQWQLHGDGKTLAPITPEILRTLVWA